LVDAIRANDPLAVQEGEDPWAAIPQAVFASVGVDIAQVRFDEMYIFHGTRAFDPTSFEREGIQPLGKILDRIWDKLHELCPEMSDANWAAFRKYVETDRAQFAWLYRHKTNNPTLHGPYGTLTREHTRYPIESEHNYLVTPEIVRDIARCSGLNLQDRFDRATTSCIVAFRERSVPVYAAEPALMYVYSKARGELIGRSSVHGHDRRGVAVEPHDVISVERITDS
jgi:hypothetical protein